MKRAKGGSAAAKPTRDHILPVPQRSEGQETDTGSFLPLNLARPSAGQTERELPGFPKAFSDTARVPRVWKDPHKRCR